MSVDHAADEPIGLPADHAFVIQFRARSGTDRDGWWAGRVEHVVSGNAATFEDCAGLCTFIVTTLRSLQEDTPPGSEES